MQRAYKRNYEELQWKQITSEDLYFSFEENNDSNSNRFNSNYLKFLSYSRGLNVNKIIHSTNIKKQNKYSKVKLLLKFRKYIGLCINAIFA